MQFRLYNNPKQPLKGKNLDPDDAKKIPAICAAMVYRSWDFAVFKHPALLRTEQRSGLGCR
jgi:hypothetical protein